MTGLPQKNIKNNSLQVIPLNADLEKTIEKIRFDRGESSRSDTVKPIKL